MEVGDKARVIETTTMPDHMRKWIGKDVFIKEIGHHRGFETIVGSEEMTEYHGNSAGVWCTKERLSIKENTILNLLKKIDENV